LATRKKKSSGKGKKKGAPEGHLARDIAGLSLMALGLFALLSLFTQVTGFLGATAKDFLFAAFGVVAYAMPFVLVVVGWLVMISFGRHIHAGKIALVVLLCALVVVFIQLFFDKNVQAALPETVAGEGAGIMTYALVSSDLSMLYASGTGFVGGFLAYPVVFLFGFGGGLVMVIALMVGALVLLTRFSLGEAGRKVTDAAVSAAGSAIDRAKEMRRERVGRVPPPDVPRTFHNEQVTPPKKVKTEPEIFDIATGSRHTGRIDAQPIYVPIHEATEEESADFEATEEPVGVLNPVEDIEDLEETDGKPTEETSSEPFTLEVVRAEGIAHVGAEDLTPLEEDTPTQVLDLPGAEPLAGTLPELEEDLEAMAVDASSGIVLPYKFPPMSLLSLPQEPSTQGRRAAAQEQNERAQLLVDTLHSFGIEVTVVGVSRGPALTRYELKPASGVKVSRITGLADDIALNMAATGVRIEAPIPGKAAVGIEVPNLEVSTVTLREVLESEDFQKHPSRLAFALGKDIAGKPIIADLARMPHVLIAGATGSGKSVCINSLVASILYTATPEEVKLIMIDPKVVELSVYNGVPHLLVPVVTDPKKAAGALNWAVMEMTDRYKKFADTGCRDLKGYNEFAREHDLPVLAQIVVIIDELADLMMVAPRDVEDHICRLAQLARAAGIHLVIATQRPSVNVITGVIKANIPSRIAFAVASQVDSRTILDMAGAEKLLGRGDMLYDPSGANKAVRVQGCFITDKEVTAVVELVKKYREAEYDPDIIESLEKADGSGGGGGPAGMEEEEGVDDLLRQAIELAIDAGQISASMLQRRFRVGYARAGRLIDEMEQRGIISGFEGSKPRTALIGKEEFNRQYGQMDFEERA
jgi:S-DNA-T family DNA segregation ATPase FtsK/SpoIIIE